MDSDPNDLGSVLGVPELAPAQPPAATTQTGPLGLDPRVVWTVGGEAAGDAPGRLAVASVIANRAKIAGMSPSDIVTEPDQFEAYDKNLAENQKRFPVGSPQYNELESQIAPVITGQQPPAVPYTGFRTHAADQTWAGGRTVATIGGNDFAGTPYQYSGPDLGATLGMAPAGGSTASTETQAQAEAAYQKQFGANPITGTPTTASVGGGRAIALDPKTGLYTDSTGATYNAAPDLGNGYFRDKAGAAYQIAVPPAPTETPAIPIVPGTKAAPPPFLPGQSPLDRFVAGVNQGMGNVQTTGDKAQLWLDQNVPGVESVDKFLSPILGTTPAAQAVPIDVARRDQNDARYASSPAYNIGKFGGEVGMTVPLMAMTGGAAGAGMEAAGAGGALDATGAGVGRNLFLSGAKGALQGAEAGGLTSGGSDTPFGEQLVSGAVTGGVLGPGGTLLNSTIRKLGSPVAAAVSPYIAELANKAQDYGIDLRGTQIAAAAERASGVTNGPAAIRDSELLKAPGSGYSANQAAQKTAWNGALAQTIGAPEGATSFSPEVMSAAKANTSAMFNQAAKNVNITDTDGLLSSLGKVAQDASQVIPESELTPLLNQIRNIASTVNDGKISGDSYLALTRTGSPLDRLASGQGNTAWHGEQLKSVVDDFAQDSLSPEQAADFAQARQFWRNMKTVEPLVGKSPGEYQISPTALLQRVASNPYTKSDLVYSGGGDVGSLARIGQIVGDKTSDSGTAARLADMLRMGATGAFMGGDALTAFLGHPLEAAGAAAVAGAAAAGRYGLNAMRGAAGMSPAYKAALLGTAQQAEPGFVTPLNRFLAPTAIPAAVTYRNQFLLPAPNPAPAGVPAQ